MRGTTMLRAFSYLAALLFLAGLAAMPSHAACGAGALSNTPYLVFGPQAVGTSSPLTQTATLIFGSGCPVTISNISITVGGTNAGDFSAAGNGATPCNAETSFALVAGENASCTVGATFTPTATGTRTATITVSYTVTGAFNTGPTTVYLVGGDEIVYVTTGVGGQVLTVDGTTGAVQVLSNAPALCDGPCPFNPTGAVVGPDGKIYVTDQVNSEIWRMNEDGSQVESVYQGGSCPDSSPCKVEGPSFSASGTGDLYFNTYYNDGIFVIPGVGNTPFGGEFNPPASVNTYPSGGTGTAFDASGNLLAADVEYSAVWTIPSPYSYSNEEPAQLINYATTAVAPGSPAGIALNKFTGQVLVADPQANDGAFNGIMQVVPPVSPSTTYTTTAYYAFTSESACDSPDEAEYVQSDMTGHLFATTSTNPISYGPAGNGCGKVLRIDPPGSSPNCIGSAAPCATLLVDLNAVYTSGIPGVCDEGECGINSSQAIGVAIGSTQGPTQTVNLLPGGGTYSVGVPFGCTATLLPGPSNTCYATISEMYPAGIYTSGNDVMNITFNEVSEQQYLNRVGVSSPYYTTAIAPVNGFNGDGIVPSLVCLNSMTGEPCSDTVTQGTSYNIFTTWQTIQTNVCSLMPHLLRGDPAFGPYPYTSLVDTLVSCTDGGAGTQGKSSCKTTSSSSCASDWLDSFGPVTGSTAGVVATETIASPTSGASFLLNQPATATFSCGQTPSSPSIVVACQGTVTNPAYPTTVVSVTSGGPLPTSLVGTNTLSVTAEVDGGSPGTGATAQYTVAPCQDVTIAFNPSTVALQNSTTATVTLQSCNSSTEIAVLQFTLTGPFGKSCGMSHTLMFSLPAILASKPVQLKIPMTLPSGACAGTYTVSEGTYVKGTLVDTTSSSLVVIP
ncbi:MAG TPA: hypothetical protein VEJ67_02400 [Candidatus Cybelea sp.]|nr:hypothetical protein [Candidatus Cybelea sp.]